MLRHIKVCLTSIGVKNNDSIFYTEDSDLSMPPTMPSDLKELHKIMPRTFVAKPRS